MAKFTVDEFVIELGLSDKITRGLGKLEKAAQTAASRIERNLNKAFKTNGAEQVNKQFQQIVRDSAKASKQVNNNLKKAFNLSGVAKQSTKDFEKSFNETFKRIRSKANGLGYGRGGRGNGAGAGGNGGAGGSGRPPRNGGSGQGGRFGQSGDERVMSRAHLQNMYGGLQRRLENVGLHGEAANYRTRLNALRSMYKGSGDTEGFFKGLGRLNDQYKRVVSSTVEHQRALRRASYMQDSATNSLKHMATGLVSAYTALEVFKKALSTGMERQSANTSAGFVFGNLSKKTGQDETRSAKLFASEMADQLGMSYTQTLSGLTKFVASAAPSMGVDEAKSFYKTENTFGRLMGLNDDKLAHANLAFEQMAAKGTISAEELKGQLAEALPGAEQLFAKAYTGSDDAAGVAKLLADMKNGLVKSAEVLPKVNAEMQRLITENGGLEAIYKLTSVALGRMNNGMESWLNSFEAGFNDGFSNLLNSLGSFFKDTGELGYALGEGLGFLFDTLSDMMDVLGTFFMHISGYILLLESWYGELDPQSKASVDKLIDITKKLGEFVVGLGLLRTALIVINSLLGGGMLGRVIKMLVGAGAAEGGAVTTTAVAGAAPTAALMAPVGAITLAKMYDSILSPEQKKNLAASASTTMVGDAISGQYNSSGKSLTEAERSSQYNNVISPNNPNAGANGHFWADVGNAIASMFSQKVTIPKVEGNVTLNIQQNGQQTQQAVIGVNRFQQETINIHSSPLEFDYSSPFQGIGGLNQ